MPFSHNYGKEASSANETASTSVPTHVKRGTPWKKILGIIVVSVALIVLIGFLYDTLYELSHPVASITDVNVIYDNAVDGTYYAYFRLKNSDGKWTTSDGTVNIKITRDNNILYEDTFTVHKSEFQKGEYWAGIWFWYYRWSFPASDVPDLPAPLTESVVDRPTNVMATITFTTPQGGTFTGTDDVFPYVDY
jgi:hypothetical protein